MSDIVRPLVSVCMITYNHELFISQAIEGVLMQQSNFAFELVIGEDCSTDSTLRICKEYAQSHPDVIRLLPSKINLGMVPNFIRTLQVCTGEYIAICEGDDFWTDPYKLQGQIAFLGKNPEYAMVCTDYNTFNTVNSQQVQGFLKSKYSLTQETDITFEDYVFNRHYIRTLTVAFRSEILKLYYDQVDSAISMNPLVGDLPLWLFILSRYKVKYWPVSTATYRISPGTASRLTKTNSRLDFQDAIMDIVEYFIKKEKLPVRYLRKVRVQRRIYTMEYHARLGMPMKVLEDFLILLVSGNFRRKAFSTLLAVFRKRELPF
jgi:glycosyltransferase involved in cell wall biosynthesis